MSTLYGEGRSALMDIVQIQNMLPHRYPFLLVDRILEVEEGKRAVGIKNVTVNEPFFQGHFPGRPIMPGVLIIEAMAQVGAMALLALPEHRGKTGLFGGIDNARFRRPVVPGDQLRIETEILKVKGNIAKVKSAAWVEGKLAAEAELLFSLTG